MQHEEERERHGLRNMQRKEKAVQVRKKIECK